jgi:PKD repeat protein
MGDSTLLETQGNFSHDYRSWNKSGKYYTIKLLVKNEHGCFDTASQRVTITTPRPEPRFDVNNLNGCPPLNVTFTNNTAYANSYWWNFGDGFKSADKNPTHSYDIPGTYNVTMVVEGDGGKDTTQIKITVFRTPEARFSLSGSIMNVTDSIHTKNNSSYASIYEWDFGDGTVVQGFEPSHKFREAGIYTVKHTAISTEGCKDDTVAFNAINVLAPCGIEFPNAFTPNTAGPSINGRYFGLEATNDIFFPGKLEKGIDKYQLEIFDKWGEIIFSTTDKEVGWDGYYRGVLSKLDVYVWKCKATCVDGSKINLVGDVTLLR